MAGMDEKANDLVLRLVAQGACSRLEGGRGDRFDALVYAYQKQTPEGRQHFFDFLRTDKELTALLDR